MLRVINPKTARGRREIKNKEPKLIENVKQALFIKGSRTGQVVNEAMGNLSSLKKPHAVSFSKKNEIHPFVDESPLHFFGQQNDASLFVFGSHSKKRPHHLTLGRLFDYKLLDMIEVGIQEMRSMDDFKVNGCGIGQKPLFVFSGEYFEQTEAGRTLKSIILDMYRGETLERISLKGLEHVISLTAVDSRILFRVYQIQLKKSGSRLPRVELLEMGPRMDLKVDRVRLADADTWKMATKVSKTLVPKKVKNVVKDDVGDTFGKIHLGKQDLTKLQTRKMKGLKGKIPEAEAGSGSEGESD